MLSEKTFTFNNSNQVFELNRRFKGQVQAF